MRATVIFTVILILLEQIIALPSFIRYKNSVNKGYKLDGRNVSFKNNKRLYSIAVGSDSQSSTQQETQSTETSKDRPGVRSLYKFSVKISPRIKLLGKTITPSAGGSTTGSTTYQTMSIPTETQTGLEEIQTVMQMMSPTETQTGIEEKQTLMQMMSPTETQTGIEEIQTLIQATLPTETQTGIEEKQTATQTTLPTETQTGIEEIQTATQTTLPTETQTEIGEKQTLMQMMLPTETQTGLEEIQTVIQATLPTETQTIAQAIGTADVQGTTKKGPNFVVIATDHEVEPTSESSSEEISEETTVEATEQATIEEKKPSLLLTGSPLKNNFPVKVGNTTLGSSDANIFEHNQENDTLMLDLVNKIRAKHGVGSVQIDETLNRAALAQSTYQFEIKEMTHNSKYSKLSERLAASGATCIACAENVAKGQTIIEQVVHDWENSPGHLANMIFEEYNRMGWAKIDKYWTQLFNVAEQ
ncbi:hypothetical protein BB560_007117 [Smittium megazygosporum]|uniref:SCP domain-containing protein n=1 Tax=Smittium megazygosporum TaxID=133381 RepID=A0A2T9XYV4_9FUNG|nr:hypothetical protein BB560_007117 [Smittium megazygosporum]